MTPSPADASSLLAELKIDRDPPATVAERRRGALPWLAALAVAGAIGAIVGVVACRAPEPVAGHAPASPGAEGALAAPQAAAAAGARDPAVASAPADPLSPALASVLDATGYVVARRRATVSAKTTGKVREILLEEGMAVAEGQVIARLDDSVERAELALTAAQVDSARAAVDTIDAEFRYADRDLERARSLAERSLLSQAELDRRALATRSLAARHEQARREVIVAERRRAVARRHLADMEIHAPFAGVVVDKAAQPGEMVSPISAGGGFTRTGLGTIVDMSSLEVEVDVNEAYINRVRPAQPAVVNLNAYPDRDYPAHVLTIVPAADRSKATVAVRVRLDAPDRYVLPDMGVRVAFLASSGPRQENAHESDGPL